MLFIYYLIQIFTSSLLCSGSIENIELACELLTFDTATTMEASCTFGHKFPYVESMDLVISACEEYFNSAVSAYDADMILAKYVCKIRMYICIDTYGYTYI